MPSDQGGANSLAQQRDHSYPAPEPASTADQLSAELSSRLDHCAVLLDIDGTLLDMAPTPGEVFVPAGLAATLRGLLRRTGGALALVSGRSLYDIDLIFAPELFPAVGGHGAEMRLAGATETVAVSAPPLDRELKRRLAAIAQLRPGILLEDKGYSLALHYRLAPPAEAAIFQAVEAIRADLPHLPIEILPGKFVCEIKPSGFNKATGVIQLMQQPPFKGRLPFFIGDDVTDESVFAIMPAFGGLAFSVGRPAAGIAHQFANPEEVRRWLAGLLAAATGTKSAHPG